MVNLHSKAVHIVRNFISGAKAPKFIILQGHHLIRVVRNLRIAVKRRINSFHCEDDQCFRVSKVNMQEPTPPDTRPPPGQFGSHLVFSSPIVQMRSFSLKDKARG
jgi:hypothetical protein